MSYFLLQMQYDRATLLLIFPLAILITWTALRNLERFLFLTAFLIPLSASIKDLGLGYGASLPGEALVALAAIVLTLNWLRAPTWPKDFLLHPISLLIALQLIWITITTLNSTHPEVSIKFLISRLTYLTVFYLGFGHLFRNPSHIVRFVWAYLLGLLPVIIFSLVKMSGYTFSRKFSPDMARPFFDDHTLLGACIAMLLPIALLLWWHRHQFLPRARHLTAIVLLGATLGLIFSFSRAAWMSIIAAILFAIVLRFRIHWLYILLSLSILTTILYTNRDTIIARMERNEAASGEDVLQTAKSVTNLNTDESNTERLNRWASALRMSQDRPCMGFGPGTYEREYGPYQISRQMTRISTKRGDRGDAHSEYLTPLTEQGWPGLLIHLILLGTIFTTGMRATYRATTAYTRRIATAILLGLLTYLIHGFVNSFLDLDKAATLIWSFAAILLTLDLHTRKPSVI